MSTAAEIGGRKPLIGLTGRRKTGAEVDGFPPSLHGLDIDLYLADYGREVLAAGGLPINLPMDADPADYAGRLDGVLLSGGADLHPELYRAEPDGNGGYEPERDRLELALLDCARERGLPILGICRGLQLVNVAAGGTLHQHVPDHARYDVPPAAEVHDVTFTPGSRLAGLYGGDGPRPVNSLHHQTVDRVGADLTVTALATDGTIEGLESEAGDLLAVQWHPEMLATPEPVFDWLIDQAGRRATHG